MSPRAVLASILVVLAVAFSGCGGGSSSPTVGSGNETFTVPSDVHGIYGELKAILDQLPYEAWYSRCVVGQVRKDLAPKQAEELEGLPEEEREKKVVEVISQARPACEGARRHGRPAIDASASQKELDLLRAGYVTTLVALAEAAGANSEQTSCIERNFADLPNQKLVAIANGTKKVSEGILLSISKPCATG